MNIKIFDVYNIRARLSVYIIIIAPVILTLYAMYEPVRSFSFSVVFIAILCAFSNYLFALQRYIQKDKIYGNTTAKYLYLEDGHINACTKKRYYRKLSLMDEGFSIFDTPTNSDEFKEACASAIQWLRNNTRENRLVQEENMLWGFYKNLLSLKIIGIIFSIIAIIILITISLPINMKEFFYSPLNMGVFIIDIFFVLFWILGVNKKIYTVLDEKYAYALLGALDTMSNNG